MRLSSGQGQGPERANYGCVLVVLGSPTKQTAVLLIVMVLHSLYKSRPQLGGGGWARVAWIPHINVILLLHEVSTV
jgi:hypothetical protein